VHNEKRIAEQSKMLHEQEMAHLRKEKEFSELRAYLDAREKERNRIARDLHDEIGSTLSSIHVYSSAAIKALEKNPDKAPEILDHINKNSRQVMENMSDIVWAINPGQNGEMSLEHKLKNYGYELLTPQAINCTYVVDPEAVSKLVLMEARKNILLVAKEAMHNIAKYSNATQASVRLTLQDENLILEVTDNGKGFSLQNRRSGHGLHNMESRIRELNGEFEIVSNPGQGTRITCRIPVVRTTDVRMPPKETRVA
jgi:signal transduction histidine kinase